MRFLVAALCAVFLSPAYAGTNVWTTGNIGNGAACLTAGVASVGAVEACHKAAWNHLEICGFTVTGGPDYSDVTPPIVYTYNTRVITSSGDSMCASVVNRNSQWVFTNTCTAGGQEFNATFGGCVPICEAPAELDTSLGVCVSPPDCSVFEGVTRTRWFSESSIGGPICTNPPGAEVDGCEALVAEPKGFAPCAGGECFAQVAFTGEQCGGEPEVDGESLVDEPGNTNCVAGGGVTVCAEKSSRNCGTVNGQPVCLESVPPGRCAFLGNGGMVCGSEAEGPTEEDGVTPAAADGTFSARGDDAAEQELRYFGPGTVATSGTTVTGTFQAESTDEEDASGAGCELGSECGVALELPEVEEADEPGAVAGAAISDGLTPIEEALAGFGIELPEGECPTAAFTLWDETEYVVDAHCALAEAQAATLEAVMLFVWAFFGVRILMET